jgi:cell division protein FtsB
VINFIRNKKKLVIRAIIIALVLFVMFFSDYGFITTAKLIFKINGIKEDISSAEKQNDSLKKRKYILVHDSTEIERIAREHFGLIKPGEQVFIILNK